MHVNAAAKILCGLEPVENITTTATDLLRRRDMNSFTAAY